MRKQYLSGLKDGTQVFERIGIYRKPKTNAQIKAWWGLFADTVINALDDRGEDTSLLLNIDTPTGNRITTDDLKNYMYLVNPTFDENGNKITMTSMSTEQMSSFFERCRNYVASQPRWAIYVPEPDKNWKNKDKSILDKVKE